MAYQRRNHVLNCRVTDETLNKIDGLRWDSQYCSRADVVEFVFKLLSDDIGISNLREFLHYRRYSRYDYSGKTLSIKER